MATFDARFTQAGFFGPVEVHAEDDTVVLSGRRAPDSCVQARIFGQWALAITGAALLVAGRDAGLLVLLAAPVFSLLAYYALRGIARPVELPIEPGPDTEARTGWFFRWVDVLWLGNLLAATVMLVGSSTGERTVSFLGPAPFGAARYVLIARDPSQADNLTRMLLGA